MSAFVLCEVNTLTKYLSNRQTLHYLRRDYPKKLTVRQNRCILFYHREGKHISAMSSTRAVSKIKADWSKIASKIASAEVPKLNKFKAAVEGSSVKVASLPDSLPQIDWAHYKAHASNPKIVEEIERQYNSLKVEHPKAPASRLNDLAKAYDGDENRIKRFEEIAKSYVESAEVVKKKFLDMIPIREMTREDRALTFPLWSNTHENPSIFPHYGRYAGLTREEQIAFEQPDPIPYSTKQAWKDWEVRKKKFYS